MRKFASMKCQWLVDRQVAGDRAGNPRGDRAGNPRSSVDLCPVSSSMMMVIRTDKWTVVYKCSQKGQFPKLLSLVAYDLYTVKNACRRVIIQCAYPRIKAKSKQVQHTSEL